MFAAVVHGWGGPEVFRYEEAADPVPGEGEVLVHLRTSSVNYHDVLVRQSGRGFAVPSILGIDGAGVRDDTGEEVVIYPALNWGDDPTFFGPGFEVLGDASDGTYAERIVVPVENVRAKPTSLTWDEAGALPIAGLTAYRALFTRGRMAAGETVLVLGAGSGVSMMAVALAAAAGARVFVTSSSEAKIERAVQLGALGGFLYTEPEWTARVKRETGGAHVVIDGVGSTLPDAISVARTGGRIVAFGTSGGNAATVSIPALFFGQKEILGTTSGSPAEFTRMLRAVDEGGLKPVIDSVYHLSDIRRAHERMESRAHFGKIVLRNSRTSVQPLTPDEREAQ